MVGLQDKRIKQITLEPTDRLGDEVRNALHRLVTAIRCERIREDLHLQVDAHARRTRREGPRYRGPSCCQC
jgi:hypothetical protein